MKLQEYLDSIKLTEKPNPLPFIHSCEGFLGEEIVKEDELKTTVCPVFKKELLYFFYGKPAYYVADKETNSRTDELYCPCCFILDETKIKINTVYPFDSGGFTNGRTGASRRREHGDGKAAQGIGAVPAAEGENPGRLAGVRYLCRTSAFGGDH